MSKPALVKFRALNLGSCAIALQRRCAALAACRFRQSATVLLCLVAAALAHSQDPIPGSFDLSFGGGIGKIPNLAVGAKADNARAVVLQPDGKIVVAGECLGGLNYDFCVVRLNANGSLDASFIGPSSSGNGKFLLPIGTSDAYATAIALEPNGKLLLAGRCFNGANDDFCLTRLNPNGTLDTSFVGPTGLGGGSFLLPMGTFQDFATSVALQPDGKIVLSGNCYNSDRYNFCVARFNVNGTLDTSFGGAGDGRVTIPIGAGSAYANALALQPDGKIVLAGQCYYSGNFFCVARLNLDGSLDATFDGPNGVGDGRALLPVGTSNSAANAVALQPNGKIVLAGNCPSTLGMQEFCVARLNPDGSFDAGFDGVGNEGNGSVRFPIGTAPASASAVALQPDGKIVLAGTCGIDFCAARLNTDGSLDTSFDGPSGSGNGMFLVDVGNGSEIAHAAALQSDGRIVLAGECYDGYRGFCVARLHGGPFGAKQCSLDVDGDSEVSASTDMLIGTRVALGMTGSAVLSGIVFAPHATRTTWPDIRTYLVSQCGMVIRP